ncbi:hypothetical protein [Undibacterium sp. Ren11W]|uniref:hypothetical protein n=1 Tax=Undibacterium sp. Ren11W TaxID=3413045 RepID=UPI003BEFCD36
MNFVFNEILALPMLAWCLRIEEGATKVDVMHGSGIDRHSDFFYEGCWSGNLTAIAMLDSPVCIASGGSIQGEQLFIACPSNTVARVYIIKLNNILWASNSMAFVVASSEQSLKTNYLFYRDDISSIINGLDKATKSLPLEGDSRIEMYCHCNILIKKNLEIRKLEKSACPKFATFSEYRNFLANCLNALFTNANLPDRLQQFKPLVSISRGYDSVTCSVLAKEAGCEDAITLFNPDSEEPYNDNGAVIAETLGLKVKEFSRVAYKTINKESEFLSLGTGGEDAFFAPFENLLQGKVFISGFHGDKVWDKNCEHISDQIIRGDPSGGDLEEFRLRVGFIHMPMPFFGCRAHSDIVAISNSPEMNAWSIGGDYDRPICRRIAEEAGIERTSFGQKKRVMSRSFISEKLDWYFGSESLQEFLEFTSQHSLNPKFSDQILRKIWQFSNHIALVSGYFSYRLKSLIELIIQPLHRYALPFDIRRQLFYWAFQKLLPRYTHALKDQKNK